MRIYKFDQNTDEIVLVSHEVYKENQWLRTMAIINANSVTDENVISQIIANPLKKKEEINTLLKQNPSIDIKFLNAVNKGLTMLVKNCIAGNIYARIDTANNDVSLTNALKSCGNENINKLK